VSRVPENGDVDKESPLRILLVTGTLGYGGAERQLILLARTAAARGHHVVVLVYKDTREMEPELSGSGVTLRSLNTNWRKQVVRFFPRLARVLRDERPDIVYAFLPHATVPISLLGKLARPAKVMIGVRASRLERSQYVWETRVLLRLEGPMSRLTDQIVCNSYAGARDAVRRGFPPSKIAVIPNGIDTLRFRPDPARRRAFRQELGVSDDETLIGVVGRLHPMKDHPTFLAAAAKLTADDADTSRGGRNMRFLCVGAGPAEYLNSLVDQAVRLGLGEDRIMFLDARADVQDVYPGLDLLVSSSSSGEGVSNVLLEAMACGVPCVGTDVGDTKRILPTGLCEVVPKEDPALLAAACRRVLDGAGPEVSSELRQHVMESYSAERMTSVTLSVMRSLLDR